MHGRTHSHTRSWAEDLTLNVVLSPRSGIQVSSVYPTYAHIKGQSPLCVCACMCVSVAKPVAVELHCHETALIFSFMDSFVFKHQVLFRVNFLCYFGPSGTVPQGGARGQNLGHLKKSFFVCFIFLLCNQSYIKNKFYSGLTFSL